jgi:hypothetical protein
MAAPAARYSLQRISAGEDTMRSPIGALPLLVFFAGAPHAPPGVPLAITLAPAIVVGGNSTIGTILLSSPAGNSGVTVTLSAPPGITLDPGANAVSGGAQGTTRIAVPAGATSVTFRVLTLPVAAAQQALISGTSGSQTAAATLTVNPASVRTIAASPSTVVGGGTVTLSITLDGPLANGLVIALKATIATPDGSVKQLGATTAVSVPPTVQATGQTSVTQAAVTVPVALDQPVSIAATVIPASSTLVARGFASALITVLAPVVSAVQLSPAALTGGSSASGTVVLTGATPGNGLTVAVASTDPNALVVPTIFIPAGSDRTNFSISTQPVARIVNATIQAGVAMPQSIVRTANLVISPPAVRSVSISPSSVFGGSTTTATVTLTGPAPPPGFQVRIASSSASVVLAGTDTIPTGSDHVSFAMLARLSTIPSITATITASAQASTTSTIADGTSNTILVGEPAAPSATLAISSQVLGSITAPDSARGSSGFTISLTLASGVPTPITVALATNHPELIGLPATVSVSPNLVTKVLATTKPVSARLAGVTITASAGSSVLGKTMLLTP